MSKPRKHRIVFYTDEDVALELLRLAREANRSISDYCHLLSVGHILAV